MFILCSKSSYHLETCQLIYNWLLFERSFNWKCYGEKICSFWKCQKIQKFYKALFWQNISNRLLLFAFCKVYLLWRSSWVFLTLFQNEKLRKTLKFVKMMLSPQIIFSTDHVITFLVKKQFLPTFQNIQYKKVLQ